MFLFTSIEHLFWTNVFTFMHCTWKPIFCCMFGLMFGFFCLRKRQAEVQTWNTSFMFKGLERWIISRHVTMFRKLPIRCARNRHFKMWESRLARVLLLFNKLSKLFAGRWRCFYYCKLCHLVAKSSREFKPPSFCKLCMFTDSLSVFWLSQGLRCYQWTLFVI